MVQRDLVVIFIVWILGGGVLSLFLRQRIAEWLQNHATFPRVINFYILLTPLVLVEEYLTCEVPYGQCLFITVPAFYFLFAVLYVIQTRWALSWLHATILFGIVGWIDEFLLVGRLFAYPPTIVMIITPLTFFIYAVLAIIPTTYLETSMRQRRNLNSG